MEWNHDEQIMETEQGQESQANKDYADKSSYVQTK